METITLTISRNPTSITIPIPSYFSYGDCHHYKIVSEDFCVRVCTADFSPEISISSAKSPFLHGDNLVPSTEKIFLQALNETKYLISEIDSTITGYNT